MGNLTVKESGEMINFISPNVSKITSFKVHFSPKQGGTGDPSPENVREITGWNGVEGYNCGKNLVPWIKTNLNIQLDHYNGFGGWSELWEIPKRISYTYSVFIDNSNCSTDGGARVWLRDIDNSKYTHVVSGKKIKAGEKGISTVTLDFSNLPNDYYACWGLEVYQNAIASMPIVYESDQETVIISDWSSDIGTIYGGYVDLVSGELVEDKVMKTFDGSETWNTATVSSKTAYQTKRPADIASGAVFTSNIITRITSLSGTIPDNVGYFGGTYLNAYAPSLSLEEWIAMLTATPLQIVYKLAEPITHQLTPQQLSTLKGQNNFWSNADYVEIEYELTETFDIQKAKRKIILNQPHVESASGDLVTFDTDMKGKLKECKVYFSPVQEGEGDPSPDNVRNIVGWNGVEVTQTNQNLIRADDPNNPTLNYHARSSYNYIVYSEEEQAFTERDTIEHVGGGINEANHARINATKNDQARLFIAPKDGIYTFTCDYKNVGTNYGLRFYKIIDGVSTRLGDIHGDADELWHTRSFTVELNKGDSFRIYLYSNIYWRNFRVIEGDGTDYIENVTNDYSISWTDSVGTIYGGYVDLTSGELVQTWYGFILDGVNNYLNSGSQLLNNGLVTIYDYIGSGGLNNLPKGPVNAYTGAIICNKFPLAYSKENEGIATGSGSLYIRLILDPSKLEDVSSTSAIKESMIKWQQENPLQIVYKLRDPIIHQLTSQQILTFKGTNNVYSDANGQTEIKYWKH